MITPAERRFIIKAFGKHYSGDIIPYLTKRKLFNALGEPFSPKSIQSFVNRERENLAVEAAIIKHAVTTITNKRKGEQARKALLKK